MARKIPMRKCVGCGEMKPKKELIRVVRLGENDFEIDFTGKKNGRGAYVCKDLDCLKKSRKSRAFERSFSTKISDEVYSRLEDSLL